MQRIDDPGTQKKVMERKEERDIQLSKYLNLHLQWSMQHCMSLKVVNKTDLKKKCRAVAVVHTRMNMDHQR